MVRVIFCVEYEPSIFSGRFLVDKNLSYLDIGCGQGRLSIGLVDAGVSDVTGIDISNRMIVEANNLAENLLPDHPNTIFHTGDIHEWQHKRQYDVIVALGSMEHIHDPRDFLHQSAITCKDFSALGFPGAVCCFPKMPFCAYVLNASAPPNQLYATKI